MKTQLELHLKWYSQIAQWCFHPHQGFDNLPVFPTSNRICGILGRERVRQTCIVYIAKSNNVPLEKYVILLDQDVHVCESRWSIWWPM